MSDALDSCGCDAVAADLAWAARAVGAPVRSHAHLVGGMASTVIRCEFDGPTAPLVLRVIDDRGLLEREPDITDREAEALSILDRDGASSSPRAPTLVASEYSPDVGRLLMSWIDGRMIVDAGGIDRRIETLAAAAAAIAATPLPDGHRLGPWWSWARADPEPPAWGDSGLWRDAIARHEAQPPPAPSPGPVLLHRDLHPLNVLWSDSAAAVVDWVNACVGHPHAELGHCRWNLAVTVGPDAPDRFLRHYVDRTADRAYGPYDPWWDIDSLLDKLPGPVGTSGWHAVGRLDLTGERVAAATDAFLRSVLRA